MLETSHIFWPESFILNVWDILKILYYFFKGEIFNFVIVKIASYPQKNSATSKSAAFIKMALFEYYI